MAEKVIDLATKVKNIAIGDTSNENNNKVTTDGKSNKKNTEKPFFYHKLPVELDPTPEYIGHRNEIFDKLKKEYDEDIAKRERVEIVITLADGSTRVGKSYETTPFSIARDISKSLAERTVISKVNDTLWDLERPLEESCKIEFFDFDSPEGKRVFWHSSAHVLGEASERYFGCDLCIGPPISDGFYYEMGMRENDKKGDKDSSRVVSSATDFGPLENIAKAAIKDKQKFERLVVSKKNLLEMFKHNKYKQQIIELKIPDNTSTTVYKCGPLIDLCMGPHVPNTGRIKAFKITKASASYFLGEAKNDSLQRIYGISFPDKKRLDEYMKFLEEAARRDHRKIGKDQELFMFNELSPGSAFWLPHGARIYNTLVDFLRSEYWSRGYEEVITPNMYNSTLWKTSGHWDKYQDDMFVLDVEKDQFGLKPMNCPGHCLIFRSRERSYRELPWRVADFGVLHRNEASGALSGLTRVRRFQQDDAHIFCRQDQIKSEILGVFDFLTHVYGIFGFTFKLKLSTRPDNFIGELETWDDAEERLKSALDAHGSKWEINPGDGAFYGPKIDITISDALGREHQCATIQLDFNLPNRFNLEYQTGAGEEDTTNGGNNNGNAGNSAAKYARPVMIHRAIIGSVERMTAILIEHFAGKWPFWLSPRQILIVPVGVKYFDYATCVRNKLHNAGFFVDCDLSGNTLQKKIRTGQLQQYNFIFIVGEQEVESGGVNVRNRDDPKQQTKSEIVKLDDVIRQLELLKREKRLSNSLTVSD